MNLIDQISLEVCIKELEANKILVALTLDQITDGLFLLHHTTRIGRIAKKKVTKNNEKVVTLHGFGTLAVPIGFNSSSDMFDKRFIVIAGVPSKEYFETFENFSSFKHLTLEKENIKLLRIFVTLPPSAVVAISSAEYRQPADIAQWISAASLSFKNQLSDYVLFEPEDFKEATNYLLGFLLCHHKNIFDFIDFSTSDDSEITCWDQNLHKHHSLCTSA